MTEARWLTDQEQRAWRSLQTMQDDLSEFIDRQLRTRSGLSRADYEVLAHLSETAAGQLRQFALGRLLRWDKSRLSQHLTRMQSRGLVTRDRSGSDRRGAVIAITPHGAALVEAAAPHHVADVRAALIDQLTAAELRTLTAIGDKVRVRLAELESER